MIGQLVLPPVSIPKVCWAHVGWAPSCSQSRHHHRDWNPHRAHQPGHMRTHRHKPLPDLPRARELQQLCPSVIGVIRAHHKPVKVHIKVAPHPRQLHEVRPHQHIILLGVFHHVAVAQHRVLLLCAGEEHEGNTPHTPVGQPLVIPKGKGGQLAVSGA